MTRDILEVYTKPVSVLEVHSRGRQGPPGLEIKKDPWAPGTLYIKGDTVWYQGQWYVSLQADTAGLNPVPTNTTYWRPLLDVEGGALGLLPKTKFAADLDAGMEVDVFHWLDTEDIHITLIEKAIKAPINTGWSVVDENHIKIFFPRDDLNPDPGTYRITILTGF